MSDTHADTHRAGGINTLTEAPDAWPSMTRDMISRGQVRAFLQERPTAVTAATREDAP